VHAELVEAFATVFHQPARRDFKIRHNTSTNIVTPSAARFEFFDLRRKPQNTPNQFTFEMTVFEQRSQIAFEKKQTLWRRHRSP
jgi:hypothetical protein